MRLYSLGSTHSSSIFVVLKGFAVVGFGLLGLALMFCLVSLGYSDENTTTRFTFSREILAGFGCGASSIALFARVAGGIFTKGADVAADLVGKIEMDIPEDDPRNPDVIADNVGDNVGDVAGMGADLFESFVSSIIAAMTLASGDLALNMLPFWVAGAGVFASILGYFVVRTKDDANQKELLFALHKGTIVSTVFVLILGAIIVHFLFVGRESEGWRVYGCVIVGQVDGIIIGQITEYFTSYHYYPTRSIADAGVTGPATVIIQGLGIGMISCVFAVLVYSRDHSRLRCSCKRIRSCHGGCWNNRPSDSTSRLIHMVLFPITTVALPKWLTWMNG